MHQFTVSTNWWYFSSDSNGNLRQGGYWRRRPSSCILLALISRESGLVCTGLDNRSSWSTGWNLRRLYVTEVQNCIDVYSGQIKVCINWKSQALHSLFERLLIYSMYRTQRLKHIYLFFPCAFACAFA